VELLSEDSVQKSAVSLWYYTGERFWYCKQ